MTKNTLLAALWLFSTTLGLVELPVARACGGFFCGRQPVDQTAERIVFKVNADSVTMIVQIAYAGAAPDFAWVLPLASVPDPKSLGSFPQRGLTALDANTGPTFALPPGCLRYSGDSDAGSDDSDEDASQEEPGVTVHYRAEVGPYDVAAIESADAMALYEWLRSNGFNANQMMLPYIRAYTAEGMKFIALKLQKDKDSSDIEPFRFDLPGQTPSIPLRMTALAAEPEMGILVFVLADQRYNGANWPDIEIGDDQIAFDSSIGIDATNWTALVARGVDEAGGQGWVTEFAGSTGAIVSQLEDSVFATADDMKAGQELRDLIGESSYLFRLYSRLSPEEMGVDPAFHKTPKGNVSQLRKLERIVDGVDQCAVPEEPRDPCRFASCGAGGICRPVLLEGATVPIAGCGCLDGTAARTTFDPMSTSLQTAGGTTPVAAVVCQDLRMSFVNPGDTMADGQVMPDSCTDFDCGPHGECTTVNMTPTCVCDPGYVAHGSIESEGTRRTTCTEPMVAVPVAFYAQRLPDLPLGLPASRNVDVDRSKPVVQPRIDDLGSMSGALPKPNDPTSSSDRDSDGCSTAKSGSSSVYGAMICMLVLTWFRSGRRKRL